MSRFACLLAQADFKSAQIDDLSTVAWLGAMASFVIVLSALIKLIRQWGRMESHLTGLSEKLTEQSGQLQRNFDKADESFRAVDGIQGTLKRIDFQLSDHEKKLEKHDDRLNQIEQIRKRRS